MKCFFFFSIWFFRSVPRRCVSFCLSTRRCESARVYRSCHPLTSEHRSSDNNNFSFRQPTTLAVAFSLRQLLPMWKWMNNYFFKKIQKFSSEKKLPDMATFWNVLFQKRQTLLEGKDMKTADIFRRSIIHGQRRGSNVRLYRSGRHKKAAFNCSSPHIWHVTDQTIDTPLPATCLSA